MRKTDVLEPTTTKHQLQEWPTAKQPTIRMYAKIKRPIPSVPGVNVAVDNTYSDPNNHPTVGDKLLLQATIAPITIAEFNATVKKTRRKAPGIDGLMVDSFKDLGKNGKTILIYIVYTMKYTEQESSLRTGKKGYSVLFTRRENQRRTHQVTDPLPSYQWRAKY